ncbi:DUF1772 domain-containing protein [Nocardia sp. NPDC088792]|uniref:anthrone oxygenase family protein n=1 Tax=Nocardia sp. NPDC088792 TaxID=3364332 RepID=UPI0037F20422
MFALRTASLVAATLTTGLIAGVFFAYATSVMTALGQGDDRTFVDVMQRINVVIINPWFMFAFMGAVGFTVLAAALHLGRGARTTLLWLAVALLLNVIAFFVTSGVNVPLNTQLANAGDPAHIADLAAVRAHFETSWVRWNIVRAVIHTLAFLVLMGALFVSGTQHAKAAVTQPAQQARPAQPIYPAHPAQQVWAPMQQPGFPTGRP